MSERDPQFEIRQIKAESRFPLHWCTAHRCCEAATQYLVMKPIPGTLHLRESRRRRCEKHAREDAAGLRITFPEARAEETSTEDVR